MCLKHKYCLWVGHITIINPAEGGEGSSLASTAATTDKAVKARTSTAAAVTTVTDKSCARAEAANDKARSRSRLG